jgi:hypothetical protein
MNQNHLYNKDTPEYVFTELWPDQSHAMKVKHEQ